jgi:hypothetical protein
MPLSPEEAGTPFRCLPVSPGDNERVADRRKLLGDLERYGAILPLITDPQAIAALEQLIRKTRTASTSSIALTVG